MRFILLVVAGCFLISGPVYAQDNSGCGDYVKIALGTTWYKNSTSEQRDYLHLLDALETSYESLSHYLSGSAGGSYAEIFNGNASVSSGDYSEHFSEYKQHIEDKLKELYQNSSLTQYPLELITGLEACHASSSNRPTISCTAFSSDPDTVIFNVQYQQPREVSTQAPTFQDNVAVPRAVQAVGNAISVKGTHVNLGANPFRFDRSRVPGQFTISARIIPTPDACQATVPAIETQAAIPQFNSSCEFNDVGFDNQFSTANQPPGYKKTYTCYNLKPGAKFIAVYDGMGEVNNAADANWFGLWLTSPSEDRDTIESPRIDYTNNKQFILSNSLNGKVPIGGDDAGSVSVTVELNHCQVNNGVAVACSTKGNTRLLIAAY